MGFHDCFLVVDVKRTGKLGIGCEKADRIADTGLVSRILAESTLTSGAELNSRDAQFSDEDLGRLQERLGVNARCQEHLARYETGGAWCAIDDRTFAGRKNISSTTARCGRVRTVRVLATAIGVMLGSCCDITCHLARATGGTGCNVGNGPDVGAQDRTLPGEASHRNDAARDQDDHGK
ncbi:hypothetical protein [Mesorhizobium sp. M7A.F.Ca.US.008.03.1.1]|uniref:hypothetical protein n=1 Tax=Mesorhizobium sp. M7A.F.Ca.US.008.03.1.1 TaxID=2496742 RepID=UPI000FCC0019|nr:hypothetical protein [Mesorhizobium sp. M7A.F.Ca.US.008.03.1.1]RUW60661.1 hypothetical protein EOA16_17345 [Mesorhizobium sp. M7A.F.Ca.US.008.03.1.1]